MTPEEAIEALLRADRAEFRARIESLRITGPPDEHTEGWNHAINLVLQTLDELPMMVTQDDPPPMGCEDVGDNTCPL